MRMLKYSPFVNISGFFLETDNTGIPKFLHFKKNLKVLFSLKIKDDGYVPKSGLLLCQSVLSYIHDKSILEIGTGETGIISIFSSKQGAKKILAVDIDKNAINWSEINNNINNIKNIKFLVSNIYEKVAGKFDIIVSNPPQLPSSDLNNTHDFGGNDGRKVIESIIETASEHLKRSGEIFLLVFDFLSVNKKFGSKETVFDLFRRFGFEPSIIKITTHKVRKNGKTYSSLSDIKHFYPLYNFKKNNNGDLTHKIYIVKAMKVSG